jgi:hypothetical protein
VDKKELKNRNCNAKNMKGFNKEPHRHVCQQSCFGICSKEAGII